MNGWTVTLDKDLACKNAVLIEGLPGIGNVGKVVIDYLIDALNAKKVGIFKSHDLPNSVFVTEDNLVQLPSIELFHFNVDGRDFLFLTGDAQPSDERASYALAHEVLQIVKDQDVKEIITLGGIGLNEVPEKPEVYVTGNSKEATKKYVEKQANPEVYGVVGPIIGITGLLLGLTKDIPAVALLGETFGHPMYIGLKEAKIILTILNDLFAFNIDFADLDEEIAIVDEEMEASQPKKASKKLSKLIKYQDLNYIG